MAAIRIDITAHGPLFDGRIDVIIGDYLEAAQQEVAQQGLATVQQILDARIRQPTPYYETQITMQRIAQDFVVHDRDIIYGQWLEGIGSRNSPVTSFPGYHAFSTSTKQLNDGQAQALAEFVLRHRGFLERMNGA